MTEHDHDPDVILALADGTAAASSPAAAAVAACAECSADLAKQRAALQALADLPVASLAADERSRLRAELRSALHLDDPEGVIAEGSSTAPRRRAWRPVWGLATAAAVFLAVVVVPQTFRALSSGSDDAVFEAAAATTTTAADGAASLLTAPSEAERSTDATAALSGTDVAGSLDASTMDDAATGAAGGDGVGGGTAMVPVIVFANPSDPVAELRSLEGSGGTLRTAPDARVATVDPDVVATCRDVAGDPTGTPVAVTEIDGVAAVIMAYPAEVGTRLVIQALDGCRVLATTAP